MNAELDKQSKARNWVNGYAIAGAAIVVAAVFPGASSVALMGIEIHMCLEIGRIYRGDNFTMGEATAAAGVVGLAAVVGKILALEALTLIPFAGMPAKAAIAAAIIKGLGESIIAHYEGLERKNN